jgi:hypothetical protein
MRGFLIGCGIFALLIVGGIVAGGFFLWNWAAPQVQQGLQSLQKAEQELKRVAPNIGTPNISISTVGGVTTTRISVPVPFDPSVGTEPARVANEIARVFRENVPAGLPAKSVEVRLYREVSRNGAGLLQEKTFKFDLTKPLPAPTQPRS